jgi:hypothetical protein
MGNHIKRSDVMKICRKWSWNCFESNDSKGQWIADIIEEEILELPSVDGSRVVTGKELMYADFQKNVCRRCSNKECKKDNKSMNKCLNKGNFSSKTEQLKEQLKNVEPFNAKIQRYISTYKQEEQREKTYIKLIELLNEYFAIGTNSCIAYNLLREGNITTDDFVQFNEEIIEDIVSFLIDKGVCIK